jgi:ribosomal protein S18 acetylase RimI-like enzyme
MLDVRPIAAEEVATFAATATAPDRVAAVQRHVLDLLARGATRPAWCFLVRDGQGRPLGRAAFRTTPGQRRPSDLVLLDLPVDTSAAAGPARLVLRRLLDMARELGAEQIGHVLDTPAQWPQWQEDTGARAALLEAVGFALGRETWRFAGVAELASLSPPGSPRDLVWHGLHEVGEQAFCAAIARVSAGSADRRTRADRARLGAAAQARTLFEHLRRFAHDPATWELATAPDGRLAGLVVPLWAGAQATIGYIGVAPELRGRGIVGALLARGSGRLLAAGAITVRGDTDVRNHAMAAAFRRAGFAPFAIRREYATHLRSTPRLP